MAKRTSEYPQEMATAAAAVLLHIDAFGLSFVGIFMYHPILDFVSCPFVEIAVVPFPLVSTSITSPCHHITPSKSYHGCSTWASRPCCSSATLYLSVVMVIGMSLLGYSMPSGSVDVDLTLVDQLRRIESTVESVEVYPPLASDASPSLISCGGCCNGRGGGLATRRNREHEIT